MNPSTNGPYDCPIKLMTSCGACNWIELRQQWREGMHLSIYKKSQRHILTNCIFSQIDLNSNGTFWMKHQRTFLDETSWPFFSSVKFLFIYCCRPGWFIIWEMQAILCKILPYSCLSIWAHHTDESYRENAFGQSSEEKVETGGLKGTSGGIIFTPWVT